MNQRLIHDTAFSTATMLLEVVGLCLPLEHQKAVFDEFYRVVKAGIEAHDLQQEQMENRLHPIRPSKN
jgi:hypothetical protein